MFRHGPCSADLVQVLPLTGKISPESVIAHPCRHGARWLRLLSGLAQDLRGWAGKIGHLRRGSEVWLRGDRHMWGILATDPRIKSRLFSALALAAGLSLAGCSDLDNALFGDQADTGGTPAAGSSDQFPLGGPGGTTAGTLPATGAATSSGSAPVIAITPVAIDPGSNTGTAVSGTIATLRSQIVTLEEHLSANAGRLTELRNQGADAASSYQDAKARITTRLQVGTTRGNPELV